MPDAKAPEPASAALLAILVLWSLLVQVVLLLLVIASVPLPGLRRMIRGRRVTGSELSRLSEARSGCKSTYIFFCSSAGEYEQAKPVMDRLAAMEKTFVLIIFFSPSGLEFARKRQESLPFLLGPIDTIWAWRRLFRAIRPDATIVIRHELWPSFLTVARSAAPLLLIDASVERSDPSPGWFARTLKRFLINRFHRILTVDSRSGEIFAAAFGADQARISVCGDTKYDRVVERQAEKRSAVDKWRQMLLLRPGRSKGLIIGSAWPDDYRLVLPAFKNWLTTTADGRDWTVLIALHDLTAGQLAKLREFCTLTNLSFVNLSQLKRGEASFANVVIIDELGILADLYGICSLAVVGGAMHHKVHNVLEPACYDLPIAFGPRYENSHEAIDLVQNGLATVIRTESDVLSWLRVNTLGSGIQKSRSEPYLLGKIGASQRVIEEIMCARKEECHFVSTNSRR